MTLDLHAQAERRLGRPLTRGELAIDLAADDAALERGKEELRSAIEAEKKRAIRDLVRRGDHPILRTTPRMIAALVALFAAGRAAARREADRLGVEAPLGLAEEDDLPPALATYLAQLRAHLAGISRRIDREATEEGAAVGLDLSRAATNAVERALARRVPGALAAAAELVSGPFGSGLAAGYAPTLDLFPGWVYTAIMDGGTCDVCAHYDGQEFDTWDAIQAVLPDGGPNPSCYGAGRCRCRPVPLAGE